MLPGNNPFYEWSMKLWEGLEQDFNFNAMVSQRGVLNLCHTDPQRDAFARRGNGMRIDGVDAELLDRDAGAGDVSVLRLRQCAVSDPRAACCSGAAARCAMMRWPGAMRVVPTSRGVDIIQNCEVTGIKIENGKVLGRRNQQGLYRLQETWPRGGRQFVRSCRHGRA